MIRYACPLLVLAACDLGIGSDPNAGPHPCSPANERTDSGCFVPRATIAVDGGADDWAAITPVHVTAACLAPPCDGLDPVTIWIAAGGPADQEPTSIAVRVAILGAPPTNVADLRMALTLSASPQRPATAGVDRLIVGNTELHYEKNGYTVSSNVAPRPYEWAYTADGFEASIDDAWLTYQGAGLVSATVERLVGTEWQPVAPIPPLAVCWTFYQFGAHTCEVPL